MTLVLGIDPGEASPGFAVWCTKPIAGPPAIVWAAPEPPPYPVDVIACEGCWPHGKMGKVQMWGLGWGAAWRTRDCLALSPNARVFTLQPKVWRAALGGLPANAPKPVIVARLRLLRYAHYVQATHRTTAEGTVRGWSDDVVEACGIAEATAIVLSRSLKRDRKGLTEVKR